jgi:LysR family transcriptional regulator, nitrogen assimilation regulatory protein
MDLRQLRYFVGIVQAGSLSRAADQLRVAQSAISHHLASLESELDKQLVTRSPKGIVLTEAGGVLYRHAEAILRHLEFAKQDAISALNVPSGRVCIGFPSAVTGILGCELLMRIRDAYPQILLQLSETKSSLLRERLDNGRLEMAVLFEERSERGLVVEPLLQEELFYVTAERDTSPITIADAAQRPLLLCSAGSANERAAQEAFKKHGLAVTPIGEVDSLSILRGAIAAGIGNSILSWSALYDRDQKEIKLNYRRFADAKLVRTVSLCFSDVGQHTPAVEAVAMTLKNLVRELVQRGVWQGVRLVDRPAELSHYAEAVSKIGNGNGSRLPTFGKWLADPTA